MINDDPKVTEHADVIMQLIDEDIARHVVPTSISSYAEYGEYVDGAALPPEEVLRQVNFRLRMRQLRDQDVR